MIKKIGREVEIYFREGKKEKVNKSLKTYSIFKSQKLSGLQSVKIYESTGG